jgi:tetratricopeptide (TPR) repeat protein
LSQRAGLFAYGHDFLRQAVEQTWLTQPDAQRAAHLAVADYFERHPNQAGMTPRKAAEWPFQLHAAEAWERLEACLTDIPLFLALYNDRTQWELTGYWHPLRAKPLERDMGACYTRAYRAWSGKLANASDHIVPANLGQFLSENGLYPAAEPLLRRAHEVCERVLGPEHPDTLGSVNNLAHLLVIRGDYAGAQPLYERVLEARERMLGPEHHDTLISVNKLALLLLDMGRFGEAEPLLRRSMEGRRKTLGPDHPNTANGVAGYAMGLMHLKRDDEAAAHAREALEIWQRSGTHEDSRSGKAHWVLGTVAVRHGDRAAAKQHLEESLRLLLKGHGEQHPWVVAVKKELENLSEKPNESA